MKTNTVQSPLDQDQWMAKKFISATFYSVLLFEKHRHAGTNPNTHTHTQTHRHTHTHPSMCTHTHTQCLLLELVQFGKPAFTMLSQSFYEKMKIMIIFLNE